MTIISVCKYVFGSMIIPAFPGCSSWFTTLGLLFSGTVKASRQPINKFKARAFLRSLCANYLPPQHSRGCRTWYFSSHSLPPPTPRRKCEISENKTNEKLLFTVDPEKYKTEPKMTFASENLWATELRVLMFRWFANEKRVARWDAKGRKERTDSLLREWKLSFP